MWGLSHVYQKEIDVNIQDQVTRPIDFYFTKVVAAPTTVAVQTAIDDMTVQVVSAAGMSVGNYLGMFYESHFYFGEILGISTNTLTLDTPIDHIFSVGHTVAAFNRDMDINGAATSQTFQVEVGAAGTNSVDITRIILLLETATAPELSDFGDITSGLTNGLVLRRVNGDTQNIFNLKTNADIANVCYDLNIFSTGGFFGGAEGFVARITFAGQAKHGVAIRLEPGDKLQLIVQDNLTTLTTFRVMAQGHYVEN
jgi:hypothetical protein